MTGTKKGANFGGKWVSPPLTLSKSEVCDDLEIEVEVHKLWVEFVIPGESSISKV